MDVPNTFSMEDPAELKALEVEKTSITTQAKAIRVIDQSSYDSGRIFIKDIADTIASVKAYWQEPKRRANEAWKAICSKENEMLVPLTEAQDIVKRSMQVWNEEQQRIADELRAREEKARREEADRLIAEAAEEEKNGNGLDSEIKLQMAATLEDTSNFTAPVQQKNTRKKLTVEVIDRNAVPMCFEGFQICDINATNVLNYYKNTGKTPPGLRIKEESIIVAR